MKRFVLLIIVTSFYFTSQAQGSVSFQDKDFIFSLSRDESIDSILSLQPAYKTLSREEKEIVYWVNYVRKQPRLFCNEVLLPFLKQFPEVKSSYSKSLVSELQALKPSNIMLPSEKLNTVASRHAKDLGSTGSSISHSSSHGMSFQERMNKAGITNCVAENVYEGKQQALQAVIFLLIDNGVRNLGHRKNILAKDNKAIGVAFYPIKNRNPFYFLVQDFSCE
ncbi:MAG: CAP domain-containing protein [Agriterribacter sp.]